MAIYLYDPRYNLKRETTYEKLSGMFELSKNYLMVRKSEKKKILSKYYIIDDNTTMEERRNLYKKETFENEIWKRIDGSDDEFLISNYGRFKRIYKKHPNGKFVIPYFVSNRRGKNSRNKQFIKCKFKDEYKEYPVARLVAYHFVDIYYDSDDVVKKGKDIKYKNYTFDDVSVYHKNGIVHDNYHGNLEFLDREDLNKELRYKNKGGKSIVAIDVLKNEIVGYFRSTRHVAENLPVSKQSVSNSLNKVSKTNVVGGRYKFEYEY